MTVPHTHGGTDAPECTGCTPHKSETPELDKQSEIIKSGKAGVVQNFIDWLEENNYTLCVEHSGMSDDVFTPAYITPEQLMADFFGIDRNQIESERRYLLERIRLESS